MGQKYLFIDMDLQEYTRRKPVPFRNYVLVLILFGFIVIALQYAVLSVLAVRQKMEAINEQVDVKLSAVNTQPVDSAWFELYKEKAWLETRVQIARTDSISLSVNLKDSVLQLELKGVVLKSVKIIDFSAEAFFYQLNPGAYHHLFGTQTQGGSNYSTIVKAPITIKKAPKDTSEVRTEVVAIIDSAKVEAVHWMLTLDNGVLFKIEGTDQYLKSDWWVGRKFWFWQDLHKIKQDLRQTVQFKVPEYQPEIRVHISEAEARAIYRALPVHPLICIRF